MDINICTLLEMYFRVRVMMI